MHKNLKKWKSLKNLKIKNKNLNLQSFFLNISTKLVISEMSKFRIFQHLAYPGYAILQLNQATENTKTGQMFLDILASKKFMPHFLVHVL